MKQKKSLKRNRKMSNKKTRKNKQKTKQKLNYLGGVSNAVQNIENNAENNKEIVKDARYYLLPHNVEPLNFNKKSNKMIKVSGALSFFRFSNIGKHKRNIILFGEEHTNSGLCKEKSNSITAVDLLNRMTENPDVCIDLFIEDFYKKSKEYDHFKDYEEDLYENDSITYSATMKDQKIFYDEKNGEDQLHKFRSLFADCLAKNKQYCHKNNSRIHMMDLRIMEKTNALDNFTLRTGIGMISPFTYLSLFYKQVRSMGSEKINELENILTHNLKDLILYFMGIVTNNNEELIDKLIMLVLKTDHLKDQTRKWHAEMSKMLDKERKKIIDYNPEEIDNCIISIIEEKTKIYMMLLKKKKRNGSKQLLLQDLLVDLNTLSMDVYFLYRWLMVFDESPEKRKEQQKNCDVRCINTIVYTGAFHTIFYFNFISKFFGVEPDYMIDNFPMLNDYLDKTPMGLLNKKAIKELDGKLACLKIPEKWLSFS